MRTRIFYHGSDSEITILRKGSYMTEDREIAATYGKYLYAIEAVVAHDVISEINGRRYIVGYESGDCGRPRIHEDFGFPETVTYRDLPVTFVVN